MFALVAPIFAIALVQGQPQEVEAKATCSCCEPSTVEAESLPKVRGPMAPDWADPAPDAHRGGIEAQSRRSARKGLVSTVALPDGDSVINDKMTGIAGWNAYQAVVPPGQTVKVRLRGSHEAWFIVRTVNRWGRAESGMARNQMHQMNPEISYTNLSKETKTIYFIVDTNELYTFNEAYTLHVTRQ